MRRSTIVQTEEGDAVEFIHYVNAILGSLAKEQSVDEVVFVKIKNWFDHKWLNFSGKKIVHFETTHPHFPREESLEVHWMKEITIPPFNPNRVISSKYIRINNTGNQNIENAVHGYRRSTETSRNLVKDYTSNGLLLWYSSNTTMNQKGSLMVYTSKDGVVSTWYALFENIEGWKITKTKGIDADWLRTLAKNTGN